MSVRWEALALFVMLALVVSCSAPETLPSQEVGAVADLPDEPHATASSAFWEHWGDGRGELNVYRGSIARYGELRDAQATLIFVTERHDKRTWIKSEGVEEPHRAEVIKLNHLVDFQTGIYPYRVMTSVFSPVDHWDPERERHSPVKISLSVQEWCGQVFHALWPGRAEYLSRLSSYFESEGDAEERVKVEMGALYADALPLLVRELDGDFLDGASSWTGPMIPSLWDARVAHQPLRVVLATITRSIIERQGAQFTRFDISWPGGSQFYEVERELPRGIVRFGADNGTEFERVARERLPYWQLNRSGDEREREALELPVRVVEPRDSEVEGGEPVFPSEPSDDAARERSAP